MTDEEWRTAILDERDPRRLVELIGGYYVDAGRAERASRELLLLHLGMLSATVLKLLHVAQMRADIDGMRDQLDQLKKKRAAKRPPRKLPTR